MKIKDKAWDKIFAKWNGANLKLNEALQNLRKLSSQFNIEDEEFENAERSVEFFGKELQIYDYLLNLIQNDRRSDEPVS